MSYDEILDRLLDVLAESDAVPQDAFDAVLAVLVLALHKLPDHKLGLEQIKQVKRVYGETFGALFIPEQNRVH